MLFKVTSEHIPSSINSGTSATEYYWEYKQTIYIFKYRNKSSMVWSQQEITKCTHIGGTGQNKGVVTNFGYPCTKGSRKCGFCLSFFFFAWVLWVYVW